MFKVGQKVVCIDPNNLDSNTKPLIDGEIYTVRWIGVGVKNGVRVNSIRLLEITNKISYDGKIEWSYLMERFRPIDHSFGEKLASEIEEEINEEQLVIK